MTYFRGFHSPEVNPNDSEFLNLSCKVSFLTFLQAGMSICLAGHEMGDDNTESSAVAGAMRAHQKYPY